MAAVNEAATVYEEFEPFCKWQRREDQDILEIHLQEFKKEQLKVQVSNHGILKISGERSIDPSKHTKFYKEVPVPSNTYDAQTIQAKFVNNNLIITLPKVKPHVPAEINKKVSPPKVDPPAGASTKEQTVGSRGNALAECQFETVRRSTVGARVAKVAVSLAAVAVLFTYLIFMYKSTIDKCEIDD